MHLEAHDVKGVGKGGKKGPEIPHVQGRLPGIIGEKPHAQKGQKGRQPNPPKPPAHQAQDQGHQDHVQGSDKGATARRGVHEADGLGGIAQKQPKGQLHPRAPHPLGQAKGPGEEEEAGQKKAQEDQEAWGHLPYRPLDHHKGGAPKKGEEVEGQEAQGVAAHGLKCIAWCPLPRK